MANPLSNQVEAYVGATFVTLFSIFCASFIFIALKNYESELTVLIAGQNRITISATERTHIDQWMRLNNIQIPAGEGYRWLFRTYPSRPWNK